MDYSEHPAWSGIRLAAPYSRRAPSPPHIQVAPYPNRAEPQPIIINPTGPALVGLDISLADVQAITNGESQAAKDSSVSWAYESRRKAQRVLDFLYVGPTAVVRDLEWLRAEGITMMLTMYDERVEIFAKATVGRAAKALGIETLYAVAASSQALIPKFRPLTKQINEHLLSAVHHTSDAPGSDGSRSNPGNSASARRAKILITCETGNDRAAVFAAAYIMATFGEPMPRAVQFVTIQRFCSNFDEDAKRALQTWGDILGAQRSLSSGDSPFRYSTSGGAHESGRDRGQYLPFLQKRRLQDTLDDGEDVDMDGNDEPILDRDRYEGREVFVPFVDIKDHM